MNTGPSELSDTVYTANDFVRVCNGQKKFADQLFDSVDWQHPESLVEEWMRNNEWVECPNCGRLVNYGGGSNDKECPVCGARVGEEETGGIIEEVQRIEQEGEMV